MSKKQSKKSKTADPVPVVVADPVLKKKASKKASPKKVAVKAPGKAKKPPIKVKRVDSPDDDSAVKISSNDKKVQTKLVVKDGMVIVEPVFNPFDES
jgi:hypothetical protein